MPTTSSPTPSTLRAWGSRLLVALLATTPVLLTGPVPAAKAAAATFVNSDITSVAAGDNHTCVLKGIPGSAAVYCWGSNFNGQLGDGTTTDRTSPVPVADVTGGFTNSGIVAVSAGSMHTCVLRSEGGSSKVYCWGANHQGQLGTGTTTSATTPVAVAAGATYSNSGNAWLSAGGSHTCVTRNDGVTDFDVLYCWGNGQYGRLGDNDDQAHRVVLPQKVDNNGSFTNTGITEVSAGGQHTCARKGNAVYCWGNNYGGQLGDGTTALAKQPVAVSTTFVANNAYYEISSRDEHTCAVKDTAASAALYCWGKNNDGRVGVGATHSAVSHPQLVVQGARTSTTSMSVDNPPVLQRRSVAAGGQHTCAIQGGGSPGVVYCWGDNNTGQLGDGTSNQRLVPTLVAAGQMTNSSIVSVASGYGHTCAVKGSMMSGVVYCWGFNVSGQLGIGTTTFSSSTPVLVAGGASSGAGAGAGSSSGAGTSTASAPSLHWVTLDTNGGTCRVDGTPVSTSIRTPYLGYRYIPSADECTKDGHAFSGWAKKSEPGTVLRLPRLIDMNGNTWRYFIADDHDLVAVWVSPGGASIIRT